MALISFLFIFLQYSVKKSEHREQKHSKLVVEEWSVSNQMLSSDILKGLLDKVLSHNACLSKQPVESLTESGMGSWKS